MFALPPGRAIDDTLDLRRDELRLDGRPVATLWTCRCGARVDVLGLAWDGTIGDGTIGDGTAARVMLGRWIADASAEDITTIALGPGWPDWVTDACTATRPSFRYTHFARPFGLRRLAAAFSMRGVAPRRENPGLPAGAMTAY
jgi:hypothetical protein